MVTAVAPLLEGSNLIKSFGPVTALSGANLTVHGGEIVAVLGPSGSGKSTLMHCLAGILRPDGGRIDFDGRPLGELSEAARTRLRRTRFGFVFQYGQLVPELSAIDNVALPLLLNGIARTEAVASARAWLDRLDIADVGDRTPPAMSGGQAQRVALARAMVIDPEVVFADEPTGSLDTVAGEQVMNLLVDSARTHHVAVLLVTHSARVAAYSDREVRMRDGRTVDPVAAG